MSTQARVAIVFRGIGDIGGTNNTIADHARALTQRGYAVDLIGEKIHKGGVTPEMGRAVRIRRVPLLSAYKWRWFAARANRRIVHGGYRFVAGHGHHDVQDVLSMHNCLHRTHEIVHGKPLAARGGLAEIHDRVLGTGRFAACICNSRLMRDDLVDRYGLDASKLPVVYPGYRPEQFNRADRDRYRATVREELHCQDQVLIGLVTSGDYAKRGLDILLEAYAGLTTAQRERTLLLVLGKQADASGFVEQARTLGIADRMRFVAHTREPQRYFHALDICVHPARFEEFGQSVQEAMACGIPVVTSRRVGATELMPASLADDLPAVPDAMSIRAQLALLIEQPELRSSIADLCRGAVERNTDEENFLQTLQIYDEAGLRDSAGRG